MRLVIILLVGYCNSYDASWTPISVPIKNRLVKDNTINSLGSNVGTDATGDSYFKNLESTGITTLIGNLTLEKNNIVSSDKGIYATAADNLSISSNYVRVVSNKSGSKIVSFVDCMDAVVNGNIFAGVMPSTGYQSGAIHFNDADWLEKMKQKVWFKPECEVALRQALERAKEIQDHNTAEKQDI